MRVETPTSKKFRLDDAPLATFYDLDDDETVGEKIQPSNTKTQRVTKTVSTVDITSLIAQDWTESPTKQPSWERSPSSSMETLITGDLEPDQVTHKNRPKVIQVETPKNAWYSAN